MPSPTHPTYTAPICCLADMNKRGHRFSDLERVAILEWRQQGKSDYDIRNLFMQEFRRSLPVMCFSQVIREEGLPKFRPHNHKCPECHAKVQTLPCVACSVRRLVNLKKKWSKSDASSELRD